MIFMDKICEKKESFGVVIDRYFHRIDKREYEHLTRIPTVDMMRDYIAHKYIPEEDRKNWYGAAVLRLANGYYIVHYIDKECDVKIVS